MSSPAMPRVSTPSPWPRTESTTLSTPGGVTAACFLDLDQEDDMLSAWTSAIDGCLVACQVGCCMWRATKARSLRSITSPMTLSRRRTLREAPGDLACTQHRSRCDCQGSTTGRAAARWTWLIFHPKAGISSISNSSLTVEVCRSFALLCRCESPKATSARSSLWSTVAVNTVLLRPGWRTSSD